MTNMYPMMPIWPCARTPDSHGGADKFGSGGFLTNTRHLACKRGSCPNDAGYLVELLYVLVGLILDVH